MRLPIFSKQLQNFSYYSFPHDLVQCPQGAISWLTKQRPFFISRSELFYEINCPKKVGTSLEKCQWWNPVFIRP